MLLTNPTPSSAWSALDSRRVLVLRNIAVTGQTLAMLVVAANLDSPLPYAVFIGVLLASNLLTWARLQWARPVAEAEVFAFLLLDVMLLSGLLYFSGGATNPFVLLYWLSLMIAAATLSEEYAWGATAVVVGCYTLLMFFYIPLPIYNRDFGLTEGLVEQTLTTHSYITANRGAILKTWGMWFGFVLTSELITYLVRRTSTTLRDRERMLSDVRERLLRDERLVSLGALAVGAAHELSTPLSTMAIVIKELERDDSISDDLAEKLGILRDQVERCKGTLSNMLSSTGQSRAESGYGVALDDYLENILAEWQAMRPNAALQYRWEGRRPAPHILGEQALGQALMNILNNAADASEHAVEVVGHWDEHELQLDIFDRGAGLPPAVEAGAGKLFFTTKESGHGLGLYLSQAIFGRFGGVLRLTNRDGGGACARVTLPLKKLLAA